MKLLKTLNADGIDSEKSKDTTSTSTHTNISTSSVIDIRRIQNFRLVCKALDVGRMGWAIPPHFLNVSSKIFYYVSGKIFAVLRFLSNLADSVEYLLILIYSRDCLLNLADNVEYSLILIHSRDCLSNLADSVEYSLILIHSKSFRFAREQQLYNHSLTKDHLSKILLRFWYFLLLEKLYPRQRSRLRRQNHRKNVVN